MEGNQMFLDARPSWNDKENIERKASWKTTRMSTDDNGKHIELKCRRDSKKHTFQNLNRFCLFKSYPNIVLF